MKFTSLDNTIKLDAVSFDNTVVVHRGLKYSLSLFFETSEPLIKYRSGFRRYHKFIHPVVMSEAVGFDLLEIVVQQSQEVDFF